MPRSIDINTRVFSGAESMTWRIHDKVDVQELATAVEQLSRTLHGAKITVKCRGASATYTPGTQRDDFIEKWRISQLEARVKVPQSAKAPYSSD
jgi:hypothetical protein